MNPKTSLAHAQHLLERGFAPIPVPHKAKGPRIPSWQQLRLTSNDLPLHFNGQPANIGALLGEPSGWLVDVDLDHPRAVELAAIFLPHTGMIWGREGKPRSHWIYRLSRPAATRKWTSPTGGMIVELRSNGCQTIAPGSVHPSGEPIRWDYDGEPAVIDPDDLVANLDALTSAVRDEVEKPKPLESPRPSVAVSDKCGSHYGREALRRECASVATAPEGTRNDQLNRAAFNVGRLIGGHEIDRNLAEAELESAAQKCGLAEAEARRTIRSGIDSGILEPRQRAPKTHRPSSATRSIVEVVPLYEPFPVEVLPQPVQSFVVGASKAIGCDASYVGLPLLSVLASAIGNRYRIELKRGWSEPAILWTTIVGESGSMKTPAFKLVLNPLRRVQAKAFEEHEEAIVKWEAELQKYDAELTAWKRQATKGHGDAGEPPAKPARPNARRLCVADTTTEALAPILLENPRGVLLARDELAGWFGSFDRYAKSGKTGCDSAHWLSMHNGEALTIDRKSGNPPTIYVPSAVVSITGAIQPGILSRAMSQEHHESGMLARLLFAMPPRIPRRWSEDELDPAIEAELECVVNRLLALKPFVDGFGEEHAHNLKLTKEAKVSWIEFVNSHAQEQVELDGDLSAAWSKLEGYAARLALVIHLCRTVANDPGLRDSTQIDETSLAGGIVLAQWFGEEAKRVYAVLGETAVERERRELREWIAKKGGAVTARDLTHGLRKYRGNPALADADLSSLVEDGLGTWKIVNHGPKGGKPAKVFQLGSPVTVTDTPFGDPENAGSGDGDAGGLAPQGAKGVF